MAARSPAGAPLDRPRLGWEFMGHNQSNARYLHLMSPEGVWRVTGSEIIAHYLAAGATF